MVRLLRGDCLAVLPTLAAESIDACVTDPPYGLEFMGKEWDGSDGFRRSLNIADASRSNVFGRTSSCAPEYKAGPLYQEFMLAVSRELLRVLKPGAHFVAFSGTRTYHRMTCAIEDAGFEIRDQIGWTYGQGFPKSRNLAGDWKGWGTALKPAWEPIVLARKPLSEGTVAANVSRWRTGALNIDATRIHSDTENTARTYTTKRMAPGATQNATGERQLAGVTFEGASKEGRWPANIVHDGSDEVTGAFPNAPGQQGDLVGHSYGRRTKGIYGDMPNARYALARKDSGSAARFFYCAKATKEDRAGSRHPTVKPIRLIRWLVRLVTPLGGIVLDPFAGTGTTGEAARQEGMLSILIERESEYQNTIRRRFGIKPLPEWAA